MTTTALPMLPTSLVGSYAQPNWIIRRDLLSKSLPVRTRREDLWRIDPTFLDEAIGLLIPLLRDSDGAVRRAVAHKLKFNVAQDRVWVAFVERLGDRSVPREPSVVLAIGDSGRSSPRVVQLLIDALSDSNSYVRSAALRALGRLKEQSIFDRAVEMLDDPDRSTRSSAAFALGELGNPRAIKPLAERSLVFSYEVHMALRKLRSGPAEAASR